MLDRQGITENPRGFLAGVPQMFFNLRVRVRVCECVFHIRIWFILPGNIHACTRADLAAIRLSGVLPPNRAKGFLMQITGQ